LQFPGLTKALKINCSFNSQVVFKENASGDGFLTCSDSEQYGKITWDEKYTNEGVNFVRFVI
jgi:hypothetical protein